jgi:phage terminase Nu1 subunit (DNA packaging protein)
MPELITPAEYSRRRGVSKEAVSKAIEKGRITTIPGENGRKLIDPEVADIQWAKNTDPLQSQRANAPKGDRGQGGGSGDGGDNGSAYWDARTLREQSDAAIADMKRRQMEGDLVERRRVEEASMRIGRMLRDAVLGVPTKLAPEVSHLTDAWEIEQRMASVLRQVLDDVAKMTADDLERAMRG